MNPRINQLVKSLLQKNSLDECSLPELQHFAERHPYFGAAQLLLTKKMQSDSPSDYDQQLQKTLLFFHNPMWVENMLNDTGAAEISKAKKEKPAAADTTVVIETEDRTEESADINELVAASISVPETEQTFTPRPETVEQVTVGAEEPANEPSLPNPAFNPEAVSAKNDDLLFEPYHTVDYFASQGIKLKEEEKPKDKFGQQLKSFTEWLKTLKKLPVAEIVKAAEPAAERKVEEMAETSIKDRDVFTEAMAEVWEKQGNAAKAIEIYGKLSLLEPSKSAYFAAKIQDLKKQN